MRFKTQNETCKTFGSGAREPLPRNETDDLIDLQCQVLDALEAIDEKLYNEAYNDPAIKDNATAAQRKAWLAIYGPMTDGPKS